MAAGQHFYKHLDEDRGSNASIPMRVLAETVCKSNYGVHRFLSHVVDLWENGGRKEDAAKIKKLIEEELR